MLDIFHAALNAVDPRKAVMRSLLVENNRMRVGPAEYDLARFERVLAIGAGKASARMALALEELLPAASGLVIVKYGHRAGLARIEQVEAGHPLPDRAGLEATQRIMETALAADERTLLIFLLSGGGSSLLVMPAPGITLVEKQKTTDLLLKAGATIGELNTVRKHLSRVKGGRLAQAAYPATVLSLILSDVIGDPLEAIASGPTAPDTTTFQDAIAVIDKYGLKRALPPSVVSLLLRGAGGEEPETARTGEVCFERTRNVIVGGLGHALSAARDRAGASGLSPKILDTALQGEAAVAGRALAAKARAFRDRMAPGERRCLLCGGETTVTVKGSGMGGRNQELALAFAVAIDGVPGVTLLSVGTDGTDGPTDAAGAIVDGTTAKRAREGGIDPSDYLDRNDSYSFFRKLDSLGGARSHIKTGPTGTNVMDIQILCIERTEA